MAFFLFLDGSFLPLSVSYDSELVNLDCLVESIVNLDGFLEPIVDLNGLLESVVNLDGFLKPIVKLVTYMNLLFIFFFCLIVNIKNLLILLHVGELCSQK